MRVWEYIFYDEVRSNLKQKSNGRRNTGRIVSEKPRPQASNW